MIISKMQFKKCFNNETKFYFNSKNSEPNLPPEMNLKLILFFIIYNFDAELAYKFLNSLRKILPLGFLGISLTNWTPP